MNRFVLFLVFFGVLWANAQEMDTTFVVNEQGQTVGIIHEKGTIPVIPQQQQTDEQIPQEQAMQPAPQQMQANPVDSYDSTAYYLDLIQQYTESGNKIRKVGKGLMFGGGIGAAVGLGLILAATSSCDDDSPCNMEGYGAIGVVMLFTGLPVFGVGTIVKMVGSGKIRRALRYEDRLNKYKMRQQYSLRLRFDPLINPINKKAGANLAMEF